MAQYMEDATENMQREIEGIMRDASAELRIIGMALSLGSYGITSREKARTIAGADTEKETAKLVNGLYINSTSVAAENEDTITAAVSAILNLVHMYDSDLSAIDTFVLATETPNDISKNNAIEVIRIVNEFGFAFNPKIAQHVQSACTSGVTAVADFAKNGLDGRALIVTTDDAKYRYGTNADETGGMGSTATVVEKGGKAGGFRIHAGIGHDRADVDDFTKRIEEIIDEASGLALVNKYPAVYGKYSEYEYMLRVYRSIREVIGAEGVSASNFLDRYMIISHIPFPSMPEKAAAYLVRHLMRNDEKLKAEIYADKAMVGAKEKFLDGFKDLETQFGFISKFAGLYYKLDLLRETRDRLKLMKAGTFEEAHKSIEEALVMERLSTRRARIAKHLIDEDWLRTRASTAVSKTASHIQKVFEKQSSKDIEKLEMRFAKEGCLIAKSIRDTLKSIGNEFGLGDDWRGILSNLDAEMARLEETDGAAVDEFLKAFVVGISEIDRFMDADSAYIRQLRKAAAFKRVMEELHIDEAIEVSKETGNLYTGSAFEGLMSFVWNAHKAAEAAEAGNATKKQIKLVEDLQKKDVIFAGFGSGDESYSVVLSAEDITKMGSAIAKNVEHELGRRVFITKEEYERLRNGESTANGSKRLERFHGFTNAAEVKDMLKKELRETYSRNPVANNAEEARAYVKKIRNAIAVS